MADDGLDALLAAAAPRSERPQRHVWLVRLVRWLGAGAPGDGVDSPVGRVNLLLDRLAADNDARLRVKVLLARFWRETDLAALFADFGFTARRDLWGDLGERLGQRWLPDSPDTDDLTTLFRLMFGQRDAGHWLADLDPATLARLAALLGGDDIDWHAPLLRAITWLVSAIRSAAFAPALRQRMSIELLADQPFEQLVDAAQRFAAAVASGDEQRTRHEAAYLRALLARCRAAAASVTEHLEEFGVSVHIVFEQEQLRGRCDRVDALMTLLLAHEPAHELCLLLAEFARLARSRHEIGALLAQHYSLLARKVAERHAETGEHYITRNAAEYRDMLARAAGGGAAIGVTTFLKFAIVALGMAPFWAGLGAGLNYATFFVVIHLLHWTVATKQPAMTAPAMAEKLADIDREGAIDGFVDEVTHLVRSQIAGIVGNLAAVAPVVVAAQLLSRLVTGAPLVSVEQSEYALHALTLLGPTALYAAFTGVLLFASSLVAGWSENWFVYHRLDSALAFNPAIVDRLGADRAARWARWWRANISGLAGNISLGLMLGVVPVLLSFFGLALDVRHVTLGAGQLAAAASTLGLPLLREADFWWCVAGLAVTGALNVGVSFWCALNVALRSRGITVDGRRRLYAAIGQRLRHAPLSFLWPR